MSCRLGLSKGAFLQNTGGDEHKTPAGRRHLPCGRPFVAASFGLQRSRAPVIGATLAVARGLRLHWPKVVSHGSRVRCCRTIAGDVGPILYHLSSVARTPPSSRRSVQRKNRRREPCGSRHGKV